MSVPQSIDVVVVPLVFSWGSVAVQLKPRKRAGKGPRPCSSSEPRVLHTRPDEQSAMMQRTAQTGEAIGHAPTVGGALDLCGHTHAAPVTRTPDEVHVGSHGLRVARCACRVDIERVARPPARAVAPSPQRARDQ